MTPILNAVHASGPRQDDPQAELLQAEAAIRAAGWWQRAGMTEHWPLCTGDAAQLLAEAGQFDVDALDLNRLIERKMLPAPAIGDVGYEWSACDVLQTIGQLEARMQWRPTPSSHDAKKHSLAIIVEQARAAGQVESIVAEATVKHDLRHVLAAMARCENVVGRLQLLTLIDVILEVEHGVRL